MPSMKVKGLDELLSCISEMESRSEGIIKKGVYSGAKVLADELKQSVKALPIAKGSVKRGERMHSINPVQKQGLSDGFGISSMRNDSGNINVLIGFQGYNNLKTKTYKKGQPNLMIARSLEKGTEYMDSVPFVRPVYNRARKAAAEAVNKSITKDIENIQKGK